MEQQDQDLSTLRALSREKNPGHGARLKKALLVLAIPATAALATACYGAPMAQQPTTPEAICDDATDNDGDGLVDEADPDCTQAS